MGMRNFVGWDTLVEFLRGQDFAAILKNDAVFHTLLQLIPNRVVLPCFVQPV